jgi:hypothetical protein
MSGVHILIIIGSIGLLIMVLELVRRRHLREKYALVWLLVSVILIIMALVPRLLDTLANKLGIIYGPSLLFLAGIFVLLILSLMLSVIVSHQTSRIINLVQQIGLLEARLRGLESDQPTNKKPINSKK